MASIVTDKNKIVAIPHANTIPYGCEQEYLSLRGKKHREWFSDHAYLCLPLVIGNQYGFVVRSQHTFSAFWDGGEGLDAVKIIFDDKDPSSMQSVNSHFGLGIITIQNSFVLRTPENVNLMTVNPPNSFIDGLGHMTGVIETDNLRRDFTFNLKFTRPNYWVRVSKGDWIGCFIPVPRYFVDSFEMVNAKDYLTQEQIDDEISCAREFAKERSGPDSKKPHAAGRRYFMGEDVYGNKFCDHQKRIKE
jgi:hypothetical protein